SLPDGKVLVVGNGADGDLYDPVTGAWSVTQGMPTATDNPLVAELPDGQVLTAGGEHEGSGTATAVLYQPKTESWVGAGTMTAPRSGAATAVLSNGQVLVAGGGAVSAGPGRTPSIVTESSAEVYSPPAGGGSSAPRGGPVLAVAAPAAGGLTGLPLALTVAGGSVLVVGLVTWSAIVATRRRRRSSTPST
ncbi:MAG TPA: hypothetical protein VHW47_02370, partial [Acidimicrobiales bacterium]|nr:hypothetical protein [Acidimicrobiales bacterium]